MSSFSFLIKAIISGFSTGFAAAIPLGPSGIESIKRSLSHGFKQGFKVSVGAILADYFYVLLINLGLSAVLNTSKLAECLFWVISGFILIIFNKFSNRKKHPFLDRLRNNRYSGMLSGFLITFFNPMTPALWIALSGTIMSVWRSNGLYFYLTALFSMIAGALIWFALLNILASRGIKILKEDAPQKTSYLMKYIMLALGIGFIIYGILKLLF